MAEQETVPKKAGYEEQSCDPKRSVGVFRLKDIPDADRRPTTVIFTRDNLAFLKKMAIDEKSTMSEIVNRWLERLRADG